jgi:hypothetical protein
VEGLEAVVVEAATLALAGSRAGVTDERIPNVLAHLEQIGLMASAEEH